MNLEITKADDLSDEQLPLVSILMPCWRRRKFIPLILANVLGQDYPKEKIELCILQDGDEDLFLDKDRQDQFTKCLDTVKFKYKYEKDIRRTIGEKRNLLVKMCSHKICAMMDSDDVYLPSYLRHSVSALQQHKAGITSSSSMLFVYPNEDFVMSAIKCDYKHQCHEACCVFTKKYFKSIGGFQKTSQGEGVKIFQGADKKMLNLDIAKLMVCVCHEGQEGNTINKKQFINENREITIFQEGIYKHLLTDICKVK
tara:strand:- start:786 stop:1550 length:765 start_codon:yes stop_codon:yes gene_type:complete